MSSNVKVPLTFKNIEGHEYQVGTVNLVDTAQGVIMVATVDHAQFEHLLASRDVEGMTISIS